MNPPEPAPPHLPEKPAACEKLAKPEERMADEDCYFDGPYLVFTAAYHLKRGSCCESGCRHCPYGFEKKSL